MRILDRSCLAALAAATLVFTAYAQQSADVANGAAYQPPRTSWGDPDLTGIWPGTAMVGVPMQRDEKLGLRNFLTEEEFKAREAQFARQEEQDNADFSLENAASTPGGDVGGPVSPPPHWLERGDPQYQASLIVDPPNGRMPPLTDAGQARQAAVREGWTDFVGLGRVVLSYPELPADMLAGCSLERKKVCRTFSDCTTAPRNGLVSGCYPLDPYYKDLPEREKLIEIKQRWEI